MKQPIDNIVWKDAKELTANHYNPNVVFNKELDLLATSIVKNGWIQPILINPHNIIIDGFHRWRLAQDNKRLFEMFKGKVPCAVLDVDDYEAMLITVRINRAKGSHISISMAKLVKDLVAKGMSKEQIVNDMGATMDEVDLLLEDDVFTAKDIKNYKYSKAWIPKETKNAKV